MANLLVVQPGLAGPIRTAEQPYFDEGTLDAVHGGLATAAWTFHDRPTRAALPLDKGKSFR